jgi:hypothetical protein
MNSELFEWLNQNQGALIVVLTLILVLVTIVYSIASVKLVRQMKKSNDLVRDSNDLSREALNQSIEFEKHRNRPYVIFDLIAKNRCFYATIKNIGKQPAYDVKVTTNPDILRDKGNQKEKISFIEKEVPFLAPAREIEDFIDTTPSFLKDYPDTTFCVEVSYKDSKGETYHEMADISIGFYMNRWSVFPEDPIKKIETHLDRMVRILQETQRTQQQMTWIQNRILESGILKEDLIEQKVYNKHKDKLDLTEQEIKYLLSIADQEGKIYCSFLSVISGRDTETYRDMLNKFIQMGLMREELDYWVLTTKGYAVCEDLRQEKHPKER